MPFLNKIAKFASSPQGKRAINQAKRYARSPEGKAKLEQVRRQIAARRTRPKPR